MCNSVAVAFGGQLERLVTLFYSYGAVVELF